MCAESSGGGIAVELFSKQKETRKNDHTKKLSSRREKEREAEE
jgi:hypothetical protein